MTKHMTFKIRLPKEPTGTSQQKGARTVRGRVMFYEKPEVKAQRLEYVMELKKFAPDEPIKGPVSVRVVFVYPERKSRKMKESLEWKTTVPDLDNLLKLLLDAMSDCSFWEDDSQISMLETKKILAKGQTDFQMVISVNGIPEGASSLFEENWGVFHWEGGTT